MTFIERRIRRRPDDHQLLAAYYAALEPGEYERAESFLKSGLERRPVAVRWHRLYQTLAGVAGREAELVARYEGYLKADPQNAALIYLRGRIDPVWDREEEYFRKAIEADPRLPWPWAALGLREAAAARWKECLEYLHKAREQKVNEEMVKEASLAARLAIGEAQSLAAEYRARLAANAIDIDALIGLIERWPRRGRLRTSSAN